MVVRSLTLAISTNVDNLKNASADIIHNISAVSSDLSNARTDIKSGIGQARNDTKVICASVDAGFQETRDGFNSLTSNLEGTTNVIGRHVDSENLSTY